MTLAYIVVSLGEVELRVVPHLQSGVVTDETVPVMPKIELLVSGTWSIKKKYSIEGCTYTLTRLCGAQCRVQ